MALKLLKKLFARDEGRAALAPLYAALVAEARNPAWYLDGKVADTIDGRFEMVSALTALAILRLDAEGDGGKLPSVMLTETFVDDMDGQLRQEGVGDIVVGKHIGKMMAALGGRIEAYGAGLNGGDLEAALVRNLYRAGWGVTGGLVQRREDAADAARRETFEEIGLAVDLEGGEPSVQVDPEARRVDVIFTARPAAGIDPDVACPTSPEIVEVGWFLPSELPALQHETAGALAILGRRNLGAVSP